MFKILVSLISGFIFALGLGISGMTQPQKVIGFLDLFGTWNPALAFVMIGAILVHAFSYVFINYKLNKPIYNDQYYVPSKSSLDGRLIVGSILFGIGWALAGFCPGPAVTSVFSGSKTIVLFTLSMIAGIVLFRFTDKLIK